MRVLKSLLLSWLLPTAMVGSALAVTLALPLQGSRDGFFFLFIPAVMLSSWYGGRTAGLVATAAAALFIDLSLLEPRGSLAIADPADRLLLALFAVVSSSIGLVTAGHRRGIIDREEALREAEALRQDAEVSSRLKDQFLATLSHELRTPLNAVLGWTRMLASGNVSTEKVPAALATIERNAQAQKQLVDDLLDVSAIVSGRLRLTPREIDLGEVVRGALDSFKLSLEGRRQQLEAQIDPVAIVGDGDRLQQVMWNLLSNAVKFTPDGGTIFLRVERAGASARITVRDTGRGIRPEFLPFIFEPFRQADASITRTSGGLGLGLALVRHLVESHGGSVTAASDGLKQGATFVVTLPIRGVGTGGVPAPAFDAARADADVDAAEDAPVETAKVSSFS